MEADTYRDKIVVPRDQMVPLGHPPWHLSHNTSAAAAMVYSRLYCFAGYTRHGSLQEMLLVGLAVCTPAA